jgi:hypothetical protein
MEISHIPWMFREKIDKSKKRDLARLAGLSPIADQQGMLKLRDAFHAILLLLG